MSVLKPGDSVVMSVTRPGDYCDSNEALAGAIQQRITSQCLIERGEMAKVVIAFYRGEAERIVQALLGNLSGPDPDMQRRATAVAEVLVNVLANHIPQHSKVDATKVLARYLRQCGMGIEVK